MQGSHIWSFRTCHRLLTDVSDTHKNSNKRRLAIDLSSPRLLIHDMSILHLPYEEPPYMRQRESNSYDMGLALEMKPSSLLPDPYMFDQLLHPLAPVASSHPMPYDMHSGFAPSHYHLGSAPYDLNGNGDVHHPSPVRPIPSGLGWAETTPRTYYPEHSSAHSYPSASLSQPSIFVSSSSSRSMVPSETTSTLDHSAPPPPWTMSG